MNFNPQSYRLDEAPSQNIFFTSAPTNVQIASSPVQQIQIVPQQQQPQQLPPLSALSNRSNSVSSTQITQVPQITSVLGSYSSSSQQNRIVLPQGVIITPPPSFPVNLNASNQASSTTNDEFPCIRVQIFDDGSKRLTIQEENYPERLLLPQFFIVDTQFIERDKLSIKNVNTLTKPQEITDALAAFIKKNMNTNNINVSPVATTASSSKQQIVSTITSKTTSPTAQQILPTKITTASQPISSVRSVALKKNALKLNSLTPNNNNSNNNNNKKPLKITIQKPSTSYSASNESEIVILSDDDDNDEYFNVVDNVNKSSNKISSITPTTITTTTTNVITAKPVYKVNNTSASKPHVKLIKQVNSKPRIIPKPPEQLLTSEALKNFQASSSSSLKLTSQYQTTTQQQKSSNIKSNENIIHVYYENDNEDNFDDSSPIYIIPEELPSIISSQENTENNDIEILNVNELQDLNVLRKTQTMQYVDQGTNPKSPVPVTDCGLQTDLVIRVHKNISTNAPWPTRERSVQIEYETSEKSIQCQIEDDEEFMFTNELENVQISNNLNLKNLIQEYPNGIFECLKCGEVIKNHDIIQKHLTKHTNKSGYLCYVCGKVFNGKRKLEDHEKMKNCDLIISEKNLISLRKSYYCPYPLCGHLYKDIKEFWIHIRTHYDSHLSLTKTEVTYSKNTSNLFKIYPFKSRTVFRLRKRKLHKNVCKYCYEMCKNSHHLSCHMRKRHMVQNLNNSNSNVRIDNDSENKEILIDEKTTVESRKRKNSLSMSSLDNHLNDSSMCFEIINLIDDDDDDDEEEVSTNEPKEKKLKPTITQEQTSENEEMIFNQEEDMEVDISDEVSKKEQQNSNESIGNQTLMIKQIENKEYQKDSDQKEQTIEVSISDEIQENILQGIDKLQNDDSTTMSIISVETDFEQENEKDKLNKEQTDKVIDDKKANENTEQQIENENKMSLFQDIGEKQIEMVMEKSPLENIAGTENEKTSNSGTVDISEMQTDTDVDNPIGEKQTDGDGNQIEKVTEASLLENIAGTEIEQSSDKGSVDVSGMKTDRDVESPIDKKLGDEAVEKQIKKEMKMPSLEDIAGIEIGESNDNGNVDVSDMQTDKDVESPIDEKLGDEAGEKQIEKVMELSPLEDISGTENEETSENGSVDTKKLYTDKDVNNSVDETQADGDEKPIEKVTGTSPLEDIAGIESERTSDKGSINVSEMQTDKDVENPIDDKLEDEASEKEVEKIMEKSPLENIAGIKIEGSKDNDNVDVSETQTDNVDNPMDEKQADEAVENEIEKVMEPSPLENIAEIENEKSRDSGTSEFSAMQTNADINNPIGENQTDDAVENEIEKVMETSPLENVVGVDDEKTSDNSNVDVSDMQIDTDVNNPIDEKQTDGDMQTGKDVDNPIDEILKDEANEKQVEKVMEMSPLEDIAGIGIGKSNDNDNVDVSEMQTDNNVDNPMDEKQADEAVENEIEKVMKMSPLKDIAGTENEETRDNDTVDISEIEIDTGVDNAVDEKQADGAGEKQIEKIMGTSSLEDIAGIEIKKTSGNKKDEKLDVEITKNNNQVLETEPLNNDVKTIDEKCDIKINLQSQIEETYTMHVENLKNNSILKNSDQDNEKSTVYTQNEINLKEKTDEFENNESITLEENSDVKYISDESEQVNRNQNYLKDDILTEKQDENILKIQNTESTEIHNDNNQVNEMKDINEHRDTSCEEEQCKINDANK